MAKKIVITSGKGGVGKTTLTANLGMALSSFGARVVLIDIDFGLNNLDVVLGLENKIVYDISDVLRGRCRVKQALVQHDFYKNLYILPSDKISVDSNITGQNIKLILDNISSVFDYVLIDCPAGIDVGFHRAVSCADRAIVVTTPNLTSLRDADKVIGILKSYRLDKINLVINRIRGDLIMCKKMMNPKDIESMLKIPLIGVVPEEDNVFLSSGYRLPKDSESWKSYSVLAGNLHYGKEKILDLTDKYSGFFGSIRRSIKRSI